MGAVHLTYGALVAQLVRDYENDEEINKQLDKCKPILIDRYNSKLESKGDEFSLILETNPLTDFVELPDDQSSIIILEYNFVVIRGALEM
ncbi:trafficking protein particle complex subunit 3-like, partial [Gigantopelta aegis]|uniref:trafficking protein particle complex subunit 3-like n=1 Tax=Gigantopelta aegis TaxID=1735272 RepID=UPI001B88E146